MATWDAKTAEWYAERYGEYATNRFAIDRIGLAPNDDVVDVGCGTGAALRHASRFVTTGRLVGVDAAPRMVEIARERLVGHSAASRIDLRVGSAEALPVEDDAFDVALAFDSFDHWDDPSAGLAEVRRVTRPGGRLCVVKDGGVPTARAFEASATEAGFVVPKGKRIEASGVTFTLWVCRVGVS